MDGSRVDRNGKPMYLRPSIADRDGAVRRVESTDRLADNWTDETREDAERDDPLRVLSRFPRVLGVKPPSDHANCACSVEPSSAVVEACPAVTVIST